MIGAARQNNNNGERKTLESVQFGRTSYNPKPQPSSNISRRVVSENRIDKPIESYFRIDFSTGDVEIVHADAPSPPAP